VRIALHTRVRADRIAELPGVAHDYSDGGGYAALPVVREL
jgi:hypothetical protein